MEMNYTYEASIEGAIQEIKKSLSIRNDFADFVAVSEDLSRYNSSGSNIDFYETQQKSCYLSTTIGFLMDVLDAKDQPTKCHCERVTKFSKAIGQALNLSDDDMDSLEMAAMLHDIGKAAVPNEIINKEAKLTQYEYEIVKMHPYAGYKLIEDFSFLRKCSEILLQHHERVDGKGYPHGLTDREIDIKSKILAVTDAYDAMTSSRPYRKTGMSQEEALAQLLQHQGSQFDGQVVSVFEELLRSGAVA